MKYIKYFVALILIFTCSLSVFAHPGSLDENGGHWNHKTGEYHYHDGTNQGNGTHYNSSNDYGYNYYYKNDEQYFTVVQPSVKNDNSNFDREQFIEDYNKKLQEIENQQKISSTPYPTPTPEIEQSKPSETSNIIGNILGGTVLSFIVYGIVYSVYLLCAIISEQGLYTSSGAPLYEATRIDHIVCFTTAVAVIITFGKIENALTIVLCAFALYTFFTLKKHRNNIKKRLAEQEKLKQQKFEEEKEKYTQLYGGKDICELAHIPNDIIFDDDNLPHKYSLHFNQLDLFETHKDEYTVYISLRRNSSLYHRSPNCLKSPYKINYCHIWKSGLKPCKKCNPTTDDLQWYQKYIEIKQIKDKYNIKD